MMSASPAPAPSSELELGEFSYADMEFEKPAGDGLLGRLAVGGGRSRKRRYLMYAGIGVLLRIDGGPSV